MCGNNTKTYTVCGQESLYLPNMPDPLITSVQWLAIT